MNTKKISAAAATILLALTATASAGPMTVPSSKIIAPSQPRMEEVYYRYYGGYYGWNPGAAIAGTAAGLLTLGAVAATGGPNYGYYGYPYYYGSSAYYGGPHYYGHPYYRHYGYYGGIHTGRSVGYYHHGWRRR